MKFSSPFLFYLQFFSLYTAIYQNQFEFRWIQNGFFHIKYDNCTEDSHILHHLFFTFLSINSRRRFSFFLFSCFHMKNASSWLIHVTRRTVFVYVSSESLTDLTALCFSIHCRRRRRLLHWEIFLFFRFSVWAFEEMWFENENICRDQIKIVNEGGGLG